MKIMKTMMIGLLCGALLCGCVSGGALVRELAKDPATVSLRVTSVYGTIDYVRTNPGTNTAAHAIGPDGTVRIGEAAR